VRVEEEISLRELMETILAGKWIIMAITIVAMLISVLFSFWLIKPAYEAKTLVAVNKPNLVIGSGSGWGDLANILLGMSQRNPQSYVAQAKSAAVLKKVMQRLNIDAHKTSLNMFAQQIKISNIKETELLEITVKDQSPQRAAEIANACAEELAEFVSTADKAKVQKISAFLGKQVNEEQAKLDSSVEEMKQFLKQPDSVVKLEAELKANLLLLAEFQARKANSQIETQKVAAALATIEKQLLTIPEKSELNPVYLELQKELALKKALGAQLDVEKILITAEIAQADVHIKELQGKLADKNLQSEQIQAEIDMAKQNYALFYKNYAEVKATESLKANEAVLGIVSPADEPTVPVAPNKTLNLAIAACLGLMLGMFVVLLRSYWANSATDRHGF